MIEGLFIPDAVNLSVFLTYCPPHSCRVIFSTLQVRTSRHRVVNLSRIAHPASDEAKI